MIMSGKEINSITELKQNFSINELIYSFDSGELEIWLRKIGESEKADTLLEIRFNGYVLETLYRLLELDPNLTEKEVRALLTD